MKDTMEISSEMPKDSALTVEGYQKIVDDTLIILNLECEIAVTVTIADIARGRGYFVEKKIILPAWLCEYDLAYQIYYVIHELVHCLLGYKHDKVFKKVESILLDMWDIRIVRLRVYPKKLFLDGKEIFNIPYKQCDTDSSGIEDKAA